MVNADYERSLFHGLRSPDPSEIDPHVVVRSWQGRIPIIAPAATPEAQVDHEEVLPGWNALDHVGWVGAQGHIIQEELGFDRRDQTPVGVEVKACTIIGVGDRPSQRCAAARGARRGIEEPTRPGFQRIRRLLESRMGNRGKKEFIQILRRMEVFEEAKLIDRERRLSVSPSRCAW
jgi:hypothetical protein